ncbi:hypothetical protein [Vibrio phage phiKT1024]|nr:hypothetical protein [Vibrio phage phiKT1024]
MKTIELTLESFNYEDLISRCMVEVKDAAETKGYDLECVAMVAYENTYESKESDRYLNIEELTFESFLSSMVESANNIIIHSLFD